MEHTKIFAAESDVEMKDVELQQSELKEDTVEVAGGADAPMALGDSTSEADDEAKNAPTVVGVSCEAGEASKGDAGDLVDEKKETEDEGGMASVVVAIESMVIEKEAMMKTSTAGEKSSTEIAAGETAALGLLAASASIADEMDNTTTSPLSASGPPTTTLKPAQFTPSASQPIVGPTLSKRDQFLADLNILIGTELGRTPSTTPPTPTTLLAALFTLPASPPPRLQILSMVAKTLHRAFRALPASPKPTPKMVYDQNKAQSRYAYAIANYANIRLARQRAPLFGETVRGWLNGGNAENGSGKGNLVTVLAECIAGGWMNGVDDAEEICAALLREMEGVEK